MLQICELFPVLSSSPLTVYRRCQPGHLIALATAVFAVTAVTWFGSYLAARIDP